MSFTACGCRCYFIIYPQALGYVNPYSHPHVYEGSGKVSSSDSSGTQRSELFICSQKKSKQNFLYPKVNKKFKHVYPKNCLQIALYYLGTHVKKALYQIHLLLLPVFKKIIDIVAPYVNHSISASENMDEFVQIDIFRKFGVYMQLFTDNNRL